MKKILAIVLAVAMIASVAMLAGCGSKTADTASKADAASATEAAESGKTDDAKQTLTMATNAEFPPYEFKDDGVNIVGIDAEIAEKIAEKLGMELEIKDVDFSTIIEGVKSGKYDMGMAGMTVSEERLESVNFSTPYATGVQVVIVPENSPIKSVDDILADGAQYKVGTQEATTGYIYMLDDVGEERIVSFKSGNLAVANLLSNKVDCVVIDNEPAKAYVAENPGLKILDTEYVTEDYAICVAKENTELLDKINAALKELTDDGTIKAIIDKYITAE